MDRIAVCILLWLTLYGCAATEISTRLPPGHPADPQAAEAVFTPPPNPFADHKLPEKPPEGEEESGDHDHRQHGGMP